MKRENPDDGIFIMNPNKSDVEGINVDTIIASGGSGFVVGGHQAQFDFKLCLCAIDVKIDEVRGRETRRPVFYVKMNGAGLMFDPWSLDEGELEKYDAAQGRYVFEYAKVNRRVFEQYLAFIRTRNKAHLLNAQRNYE